MVAKKRLFSRARNFRNCSLNFGGKENAALEVWEEARKKLFS